MLWNHSKQRGHGKELFHYYRTEDDFDMKHKESRALSENRTGKNSTTTKKVTS